MADNTADLEQPHTVEVSYDLNATKIRMTPLEEENNLNILELFPDGIPDDLAGLHEDVLVLLANMWRKPPVAEVGKFCDEDPTILVRAFEYKDYHRTGDHGVNCSSPPLLINFHKVDLELSELEVNCYPDVFTRVKTGHLFGGSSKIYMLGRVQRSLYPLAPGAYPPDIHSYHGASVLDTKTKTWNEITLQVDKHNLANPVCASFHNGEKLYHFGAPRLINPQSYNSSTKTWEDLTIFQKFPECRMKFKVVSDPINKRILFNISGPNLLTWGYLYAYYPDEPDCEKQIQLVSVQVPWSDVVVVAKDVAYVRQPGNAILCAYDLSTWISKPLDVAWTSTVLKDTNGDDVDLKRCGCQSLFYMGRDIFWMAFWSTTKPDKTWLYFLKFIATRKQDKITCTPCELRCYSLESNHYIYDFLMIQQQQ